MDSIRAVENLKCHGRVGGRQPSYMTRPLEFKGRRVTAAYTVNDV